MTIFLRRNYRWLVVALLFLLSTVNYLDRQTLSVLAPTLRDLHGLTSEHYSYIVTGFLVAYMAGYAIVGPLLDRYGVKKVITVAVALWSIAATLHSLAAGWIGLFICRVLLGLGESAAPIGGAKAVGEWIPARERGLAMGIFSTGNIVGAIVAAPLVTMVLLKASWQAAFIVTGTMAIVWLFAWIYLYHAPESERRLSEEERAMILGDRPQRAEKEISAWAVLRHRYGYGLFIARLLTDTVPFFFSFWLPEYLHRSRDISVSMIGVVAWIPYLAADLGGLSGGGFSDFLVRRGRRPRSARFTVLLVAAGVTPLACVAVRTRSIVIALGFICCVLAAHSAWIVNLLTLITESAPVGHAGATLGISSVGGALGGVIMSLAAGRLIPAVGYTPLFTILGFMHLCGFAVLWLALRGNGHAGKGAENYRAG